MKVCVVGGGGREHALAHVLSRTAEVVVAPGSPGMVRAADADRPSGMVRAADADRQAVAITAAPAEEIEADLFVIGPEAPLVDGLAHRLRSRGRLVFGPGADGARLEGSKAWMKEMCVRAGVPTARYAAFTEEAPALAYLEELAASGSGLVIKTDGLAAGKGVLVTGSYEEAAADVRDKLSGRSFGPAGATVVIEEGLVGEEVTLLAVSDGRRFSVLPASQDHKRVGDGDTGANTGGMGAYCPVPHVPKDVIDVAIERCVEPMFDRLRADGIDYRGVLYAGLMISEDGPRIIEYNVRFGDPESEAVLPLLDGDVASWLASAAGGSLDGDAPVSTDACITVVMCAEGYGAPAGPRTGDAISGLGTAAAVEGVTVFHAGTAASGGQAGSAASGGQAGSAASGGQAGSAASGNESADHGGFVTAGGRVLAVTARRPTLAEARDRAYEAVRLISWPGAHYRTDIAGRALSAAQRGVIA